MQKSEIYRSDLTSQALEESLPTLTEKLRKLQELLSEDEKSVFSDIIKSATTHLSSMEQSSSINDKLSYIKPISATASIKVRNEILALPEALNLH